MLEVRGTTVQILLDFSFHKQRYCQTVLQ